MIIKKTILPLLFLFLIIVPSITFATNEKYKLLETIPLIGTQGSSNVNLSTYLLGAFKFIIASVAIASLVMIIIGGYLYIISTGNQAKSSNAKEIIWNALIGLIISFFIGILFLIINPDILSFSPKIENKIIGHTIGTGESISNSIGGKTQPPGITIGASGNAMADAAMAEYIFWGRGSTKECNPAMTNRLRAYWASAGLPLQNCKSVPWSAAFISHVTGLSAAGHWKYINDAYHGRNGWTFNKPSDYTPQVGDLICGSRSGGRFNSNTNYKSHCDIVHSVNGNKVTTIGGNVGDSVKLKTWTLKNGRLTSRKLIAILSK